MICARTDERAKICLQTQSISMSNIEKREHGQLVVAWVTTQNLPYYFHHKANPAAAVPLLHSHSQPSYVLGRFMFISWPYFIYDTIVALRAYHKL